MTKKNMIWDHFDIFLMWVQKYLIKITEKSSQHVHVFSPRSRGIYLKSFLDFGEQCACRHDFFKNIFWGNILNVGFWHLLLCAGVEWQQINGVALNLPVILVIRGPEGIDPNELQWYRPRRWRRMYAITLTKKKRLWTKRLRPPAIDLHVTVTARAARGGVVG